jgi:hypothetical protein
MRGVHGALPNGGDEMKCYVCNVGFTTPGRFMHHAVTVHAANRASVERAISQSVGGIVALVPTRRGKVMMLIQPPML